MEPLLNLRALLQPKRLGKPLLIAAAMFYLGFHSLHGERGLYALFKEQQKQEALNHELALVVEKREAIENRIARFQSAHMDLDLLDEQLRRRMGLAPENEYMILLSQ